MKRYLGIIALLLCLLQAHSQELIVKSFTEKTFDMSASTNERKDLNGEFCALVKVQLASSGAVFSGNVVGEVKYNTSEYWVYMVQGSKRLKIRLEGYLPLEVNFEDYEVKSLESKTVYIMVVSGITTSQSLEAPRIKTGWIILDSEPTGASVFINDEFVGNTPLTNYKQAYGTYSYRVEHPNYHSSTGTIELKADKLEKKIELKPAFGSIAITSSVAGANVLLDGAATNKTTPCTLVEVPSGQHTITIQKDKYSPKQQKVTVEDGQTAQLSISLDARFAQVSITSLDGAQIYCNGKQIGTTKHVEDMMEGYYDLEARLEHHKSATKQIQVIAGQAQEITLNPVPIYGSLDITSTPHEADVTIDGKLYGKTPLTIEQLLEGEHKVIISKRNFASYNKDVIVHEKEVINISVKLQDGLVIIVEQNESLATKLNSISDNSDVLIIQGHLNTEDWKELGQFCKKRKVKSISFKDYGGSPIINNGTFSGCSELSSITIPNGVTSIGSNAFQGCTGLTSITIPNSVTSIGSYAFNGCTGLTSIAIPNSVTEINQGAFQGCTGLTSITIPNSVKQIAPVVFTGCTGLASISVEGGNTTYDSRDKCNAIIETKSNQLIAGCKTTVIPNSVKQIGWDAFNGCTGLTSITIPNNITEIGSSTFMGCTGLTSITIPNSVKRIGEQAFYHCTGLTSISIPHSVTVIGENAFSGCTGLTSISIPNSVTIIGSFAFSDCTGLTSISIPNGVKQIRLGAFSGCTGLTSISIPNSVTEIKGSAFSGCTGLTSITIPNSVREIGWHAFNGCTSLTSIAIPYTTNVDDSAFNRCPKIKITRR